MRTNRHHTLWPKADYRRTNEPLILRYHPSMVHRMDVQSHNDLHHEVQPLRVMSKGLAIVALNFLPNTEHWNSLDSLAELQEYLARRGRGTGRLAVESSLFAENLEEQLRFM